MMSSSLLTLMDFSLSVHFRNTQQQINDFVRLHPQNVVQIIKCALQSLSLYIMLSFLI